MRETASALEAAWKVKHRESAEAAFLLADEGFVRETGPSFFRKVEVPETVLQAKKE
jgi:hypothetical protein